MRENKFRVWDNYPYVKGYLDSDSVFLMSDGNCLVDDVGDDIDMSTTIIEFYTGMTDKNSVEIYEGDIVQTNEGIVQTVVGITPIYINEDVYTLVQATKSLSGEIFILDNSDVVIGNIHENPELLEVD